MSPVKLFQDKNLSTPEVQPDKTGKSSEAHREPPETGSREAKESSFTLVLQPGSDSCHSRRLFSTSPDEIQVPFPANQELPLLQEPTVKTADIIEKAKVSTRLKTRPRNLNVEKSPPLYSCHVQLDHLHYVSADVSRHETNHVDGTRHETNSGFVRSKRTLSTRVRTERKRLKSETKNGAEPPPLKQKVPSALSDGHEALKRAAKCRNVKRKLLRDEHDDASGKTVKCKSVEPTEPPSSVHLPAPAELAARSEGAPNVGRGRPIKRPAKAPRGELQAQTEKPQAQMSTEPFYFEMTPFEGKPLECSNPNRGGDQDATASRLRNVKVNGKQPRGDPRSRKSRFSRTHAHNATPSATAKDLPTPTTQSGLAGHLLRRYSCPDIPSLFASLPRQPPLTLVPAHDPAGSRRTRRHTVSCGEVEREIAPLCLRKEVYPSRRSFPCDGQNLPPALLPSWSLSALAPKQENPGKVSSIRIRRALPKPQNNLTPMGLPKAIRLKKKQFSLEEIYTNKNFSKPPESRLETVFEVPLSRRDGSESRFGQRRLKRFVEFHEAGAASSRTRRGGFARDDAGPSLLPPPDADSLLCAKLKQLDLWLIGDQLDAAS
uniref:Tantalus-like domain-containing protein n=1 Tax=Hippocampus comes TaxID=109280 RepID=A0A3Q2XER6_HIPCM